ncbi:MAG: hypothetical protein ACK4MS_12445 [Paracoccaceae bacterium]
MLAAGLVVIGLFFIFSELLAICTFEKSAITPKRKLWAGPGMHILRNVVPEDDPYSHVIADDARSSRRTGLVKWTIPRRARGL